DALLTHPHPVCQDANAALAAAIAVGVAGGSRADMLEAALGMAADEGEGAAVRRCLEAAAAGEPVGEFQQQMGWVLIALQNAFFHLAQGSDVRQAVEQTIVCGGDTDTNACIVGALIGAVDGPTDLHHWSLTIAPCRPIATASTPPHPLLPRHL